MTESSKTRKSYVRVAATLLGGSLLVGGCIRQELAATLSSKELVSGTFIVAYDKVVVSSLGASEAELKKNVKKSLARKLPKGVTDVSFNAGKWLGIKYTMKAMPVDKFLAFTNNASLYATIIDAQPKPDEDLTDNMTLGKNEAGQWVFAAPSGTPDEPQPTEPPVTTADGAVVPPEDGASGDNGDADLEAIYKQSPPVFSIAMTFPGAVISADAYGVVSGNNVTWRLTPEQLNSKEPWTLTATANPQ
jgi:hypothetical protein